MKLLNKRYHILNTLGKPGGFGHVSLAEDTHQSSRRCAVKQLTPVTDHGDYKWRQERFEREAVILGELGEKSNGQIPKLYDYFVEKKKFYLVQELIEGQTLGEKVENEGPLNVTAVMEILGSLLSVLTYIHNKSRIHRDIKPDNVILRQEDGKPVLLDFGSVKEVINLDSQGNPTTTFAIGTRCYMPPEQQNQKPVYASDLYALGWTGIYLLTGKHPDEVEKFQWRKLAHGVDSRFANILDKATEFETSKRYKTTTEMRHDLHYAGLRIQPHSDEIITNSIGMKFVLIAAGSFTMGSERRLTEKPALPVTINESFYMGRYQVTQAEWRVVMGSSPSKFEGDDLPVETVSWDDVQQFLHKFNAITDGCTYRLPTEAEWEYACRADSTAEYCFGDNKDELGQYAWYEGNSENSTHRVGEKDPNVWGLYDMHGNVWEWCQDTYQGNYEDAPADGSAWEVESDYKVRVLRGGAWNAPAKNCRSAFRRRNAQGNRGYHDGFRVVALVA
jgi:formylglycine-generating enzyme required for sulfatase activity